MRVCTCMSKLHSNQPNFWSPHPFSPPTHHSHTHTHFLSNVFVFILHLESPTLIQGIKRLKAWRLSVWFIGGSSCTLKIIMTDLLTFDKENAMNIKAVENSFGATGRPLSKPGRMLMGEGRLIKQGRRRTQPKMFFLFNDVLVYGSIILTGPLYRNQKIIPLGEKFVCACNYLLLFWCCYYKSFAKGSCWRSGYILSFISVSLQFPLLITIQPRRSRKVHDMKTQKKIYLTVLMDKLVDTMPYFLSFQRTSSWKIWRTVRKWGTNGSSVHRVSPFLCPPLHLRKSKPGLTTYKSASQACWRPTASNQGPRLTLPSPGSRTYPPSDACAVSKSSLWPNADTTAENAAFWSAIHAPNSESWYTTLTPKRNSGSANDATLKEARKMIFLARGGTALVKTVRKRKM